MKKCYTACFALFAVLAHSFTSIAATEPLTLQRADGSSLTGYYDLPDKDSFPIGIVIDGLRKDSVYPVHEGLKDSVNLVGVALISLEKQGIYSQDNIDELEYNETNDRYHRIDDHRQFIGALRDGFIPGWNGELIFIGGSEGAAIGAVLSAETPETIASLLFSAGGGWNTIDELRWTMRYHLKHEFGFADHAIETMMWYADYQMEEMVKNPTPNMTFCSLPYKWWAGHLNAPRLFEVLKNVNTPIYFGHGVEDYVIPIASADLLAEEFEQLGKTNLTYRRIENCPHDVSQHTENVFEDAFQWLTDLLAARSVPKDGDLEQIEQ